MHRPQHHPLLPSHRTAHRTYGAFPITMSSTSSITLPTASSTASFATYPNVSPSALLSPSFTRSPYFCLHTALDFFPHRPAHRLLLYPSHCHQRHHKHDRQLPTSPTISPTASLIAFASPHRWVVCATHITSSAAPLEISHGACPIVPSSPGSTATESASYSVTAWPISFHQLHYALHHPPSSPSRHRPPHLRP